MTHIKYWRAHLGDDVGVNTMIEPAPEAAVATQQRSVDRGGFQSRRLRREHRTMRAMIECYCEDHHGAQNGLCPDCQGLLDYAALRLERCRFGEAKPTCAKCPVHCYQAKWRMQVKEVMRYAGPKMLWRHPALAIGHLLDGLRKVPELKARQTATSCG